MRTRVRIPTACWICAAICAHFPRHGRTLVVAKVHMSSAVHQASNLAQRGEQTFEVSMNRRQEQSPSTSCLEATGRFKPPPRRRSKRRRGREEEGQRVVVVEKRARKPTPVPEQALKNGAIAVWHGKSARQPRQVLASRGQPSTRRRARRRRRTTATRSNRRRAPRTQGADQQPGDSRRPRRERGAASEKDRPRRERADLDVRTSPDPQGRTAAVRPHDARGRPAPCGHRRGAS